jgi:cytochrome b
MSSILVWDLPTRLFHWLLAAGFLTAFGIAVFAGDDHPLFPYHALLGLTLALMVMLRIVWGFVGTRYARFASFPMAPPHLIEYAKGLLKRGGPRYIGHNPGSSYAIVALLALILCLAVTGVLLGKGWKAAKEVHEICAYATIAVVGVHVLGVIVHTLRHKENVTLAMIRGRRGGDSGSAIASAHPLTAIAFLVLLCVWGVGLYKNYDPSNRHLTTPFSGTALQLGDIESEEIWKPQTLHEERDED